LAAVRRRRHRRPNQDLRRCPRRTITIGGITTGTITGGAITITGGITTIGTTTTIISWSHRLRHQHQRLRRNKRDRCAAIFADRSAYEARTRFLSESRS
jgi:hypothetical protein